MPPRQRSLLLLPGLACDARLFAGQLPALAQHHRVHVSDVHYRCPGLPEMAAALLAEQAGSHILVGCSMGGMLALEILRQAPDRVQAVALLGSSARGDTAELIRLRSQACELFAAGRMAEVLRANLLFAFHPANQGRQALVGDYLAMIERAGAEQLIRQNRAVMARPDSRPLLPQIRCPLLVVCGEADGLTPPEHSREIAEAAVGAELHIVAGAGHMLTMEEPAAVTALLLDWLQRLPACGA
ncbi:MAG TPA: alpha/beta fold hydrolase [Rubrivivax sp.]|nr:alpha/beta fold hydrolase [Rubrivivax sp.]